MTAAAIKSMPATRPVRVRRASAKPVRVKRATAKTAARKKKRLLLTKTQKKAAFAVLAAALLCGLAAFVLLYFRVETVRVDGNVRYTDEEIKDMILRDALSDNTLYLSLRYGNRPVTDVPYIERMDVKVTDHDSVRIIVYEKALAGYVEYLGRYMYFDRNGVVVGSSDTVTEGVAQVVGLNYDHVMLYERLPISNEQVFQQVLSVTQQLEKYNLEADKIFFDVNYNIYLYFGDVEAELGSGESYIDEKLEQLVHILPELADKRGILRMKDYTPTSRGITFEKR